MKAKQLANRVQGQARLPIGGDVMRNWAGRARGQTRWPRWPHPTYIFYDSKQIDNKNSKFQ